MAYHGFLCLVHMCNYFLITTRLVVFLSQQPDCNLIFVTKYLLFCNGLLSDRNDSKNETWLQFNIRRKIPFISRWFTFGQERFREWSKNVYALEIMSWNIEIRVRFLFLLPWKCVLIYERQATRQLLSRGDKLLHPVYIRYFCDWRSVAHDKI